MAKTITSEIEINATAEKIWKILTDFEAYPEWNPFIVSLQGPVATNQKFNVKIKPVNGQAMTFKPTVLVYEPNKEFRWLGHLLFNGLFDGEHSFRIIELNPNKCNFIQSETFKGILVPLFKTMLEVNTFEGFKLMNSRLKELAERN